MDVPVPYALQGCRGTLSLQFKGLRLVAILAERDMYRGSGIRVKHAEVANKRSFKHPASKCSLSSAGPAARITGTLD